MKLIDIARVIRSKNAGPTTLTLDLLFNDEAGYKHALGSPALQAAAIAPLYGLRVDQVQLIYHRVYGIDGVFNWPSPPATLPREVFVMVEIIAQTGEAAKSAATVFKQFLLHHGFPGRISTGGNLAFPFTPPEVVTGPAYRFSAYHVMEADNLPALFPISLEQL